MSRVSPTVSAQRQYTPLHVHMKERHHDDSPICAPGQHHELQQWLQNQPSPENVHLATPATSTMSPFSCKLQCFSVCKQAALCKGSKLNQGATVRGHLDEKRDKTTCQEQQQGMHEAMLQLTFRGHHSGLQAVKKLGRAFRLKPGTAPKGLLPLLGGPQPESVTPVEISLSATLWSSILVAWNCTQKARLQSE